MKEDTPQYFEALQCCRAVCPFCAGNSGFLSHPEKRVNGWYHPGTVPQGDVLCQAGRIYDRMVTETETKDPSQPELQAAIHVWVGEVLGVGVPPGVASRLSWKILPQIRAAHARGIFQAWGKFKAQTCDPRKHGGMCPCCRSAKKWLYDEAADISASAFTKVEAGGTGMLFILKELLTAYELETGRNSGTDAVIRRARDYLCEKQTADYTMAGGKVVRVEYDPNAACIMCGLPVVSASVGGTAICPWCDSGYNRDGTRWTFQQAEAAFARASAARASS